MQSTIKRHYPFGHSDIATTIGLTHGHVFGKLALVTRLTLQECRYGETPAASSKEASELNSRACFRQMVSMNTGRKKILKKYLPTKFLSRGPDQNGSRPPWHAYVTPSLSFSYEIGIYSVAGSMERVYALLGSVWLENELNYSSPNLYIILLFG